MTEAEWLTCTEPAPMLRFLSEWASDRKQRLFGCSCYRSLWGKVPVAEIRWDVLRASEAFADGSISRQALKLARKRLPDWEGPEVSGRAMDVAARSSWRCLGTGLIPGHSATHERPDEALAQVAFLRDIFGNPFRPVTFSPQWRTSTAVSLASGVYGSRDFSAMPILADALQDAGCDSVEVLDHCRGDGPHVRGCWVVDLVLGKE